MKPVMVKKVRGISAWRQQHGSAALITTIAISAILVVLFVGITTIATREISQSISSDNASRALYAAEAGVEDAVRELVNNPGYRQNTCNEDPNPSKSGQEVKVLSNTGSLPNVPDVAWTCRTVTTVTADLTGRLQKDESLQINLALGRSGNKDSDPFLQATHMTIEWNDPKVDSSRPFESGNMSFLPRFPDASQNPLEDWVGRAAIMEVTATWIKTTGNGPVKQIDNNWAALNNANKLNVFPVRTVLASPVSTNSVTPYSDFSPWNDQTYPQQPPFEGGVSPGELRSGITAQCTNTPTVEYSCKSPFNAASTNAANMYPIANLVRTEINNGTNNVFINDSASYTAGNTTAILRFKPRYAAASYRLRFFNVDNSGNVRPVYLPDGYATIDVTARSGNYFRRVVAKKQITPGAYDGVFDNAIFSGKDICKTMQIYRDFRGAPDFNVDASTGARVPNDNAGKNIGCVEG